MPLANFPSSKQLALALSRVGVRAAVLEKMERRLDADGPNTLTGLMLSDQQVATLGFKLYRLKHGILTQSGQPRDDLPKALLPNTDEESSSIAKINKWIALADIAMRAKDGDFRRRAAP
jgi:hypothetical protein